SGLKTTLWTPPVCPLGERRCHPFSTSRTFTVPSKLPKDRSLPLGLKTTLVTPLVCPSRERSSCPFSASHTFTSLELALARRLPSGLKTTVRAGPVCPRKVCWFGLVQRV